MVRRRSCSIAAQAAPPTVAGHARPGELPCAGRHGSCNLVADESERAPGHRRPVRCRGVPRFQRSRRSECLHISSASEPRSSLPARSTSPSVSWSQADPKVREWVEANRQALELFQQGAEQSDAAHPAGDPVVMVNALMLLALLEGEQAAREWRHGGCLGLLSRGPPHGNSRQAAGELGSA